jgi:hypothetical protein
MKQIAQWGNAQGRLNWRIEDAYQFEKEKLEDYFKIVLTVAEEFSFGVPTFDFAQIAETLLRILLGEESFNGVKIGIDGIGPFLTTSVLRFYIPNHAAAMNSSVASVSGLPLSPSGWARYRKCCENIAGELNSVKLFRDQAGASWRTADIDLVVWQFVREHS